MPDFSNLFNESKIHPLSIKDLASWRRQKEGRRLLLPPIQRSLVWKNEQIINYWDSLLRGYPPGMMMVHSLLPNNDENNPMGYDADGQECKNVDKNDIMLFDGQQRMATILLALGEGQMKDNRKLWIDLGTNSTNNSGLKFQLRISSTGQPFGYKPNKPNQKIELGKRQQKWEAWRRINGGFFG